MRPSSEVKQDEANLAKLNGPRLKQVDTSLEKEALRHEKRRANRNRQDTEGNTNERLDQG